ncbi:MAG: NYN domain-containing protein [Candidatus ainarchaeum sp.]|nr:NYN domain-containing protein [Candidatus ainarchaeum sp.]
MGEKQDSAIVFIDFGYLKKIFDLFKINKFNVDLKRFSIILCKEQKLFCKRIYLYDAPPFKDNKKKLDRYNSFISQLKKRGLIIKEGRCQKILIDKNKRKYEFKQKGVDTHITMDLLTCAFEKKANNFILITADTDFVPVIEKIKKLNINIILYCVKNKERHLFLSNHLLDACNYVGLIKKEKINGESHGNI